MLGSKDLVCTQYRINQEPMHLMMKLIRPQTLEQGQYYLHRENPIRNMPHSTAVVLFMSYTACPACVVVQDESGKKIRCPRDDLFELHDLHSNTHRFGSTALYKWVEIIISTSRTFLRTNIFQTITRAVNNIKTTASKIYLGDLSKSHQT